MGIRILRIYLFSIHLYITLYVIKCCNIQLYFVLCCDKNILILTLFNIVFCNRIHSVYYIFNLIFYNFNTFKRYLIETKKKFTNRFRFIRIVSVNRYMVVGSRNLIECLVYIKGYNQVVT